ncbi:MAG TPA: sigma factor [Ktedonobacteraceae bacterium]|nr:sigma factor [Ktedonobacteraceae bacterium]
MDKLARDDEERLIACSQQGDISAFNQLVLHHQQVVYNTVFRLLGDYDTAADVTQEAFISALKLIPRGLKNEASLFERPHFYGN